MERSINRPQAGSQVLHWPRDPDFSSKHMTPRASYPPPPTWATFLSCGGARRSVAPDLWPLWKGQPSWQCWNEGAWRHTAPHAGWLLGWRHKHPEPSSGQGQPCQGSGPGWCGSRGGPANWSWATSGRGMIQPGAISGVTLASPHLLPGQDCSRPPSGEELQGPRALTRAAGK